MTTTVISIDIKDKITPEQWERLNEVAYEALSCGYFAKDGKTDKASIENKAVESFVEFLEEYFVTEKDRYDRDKMNRADLYCR